MARAASGASRGELRAYKAVGAALVVIGSVNSVVELIRLAEQHWTSGFLWLVESVLLVVLGLRVRGFQSVEQFRDRPFKLLAAALAILFLAEVVVR